MRVAVVCLASNVLFALLWRAITHADPADDRRHDVVLHDLEPVHIVSFTIEAECHLSAVKRVIDEQAGPAARGDQPV